MLKTKAIFERKTNDFKPRECVIGKIIGLSSQEYDAFSQNLLADYDFIRDNIDLMFCDGQGAYHCLLVTGKDRPDGILLESEGYFYGRYTAFLPNAADFLAAHPEQVQQLSQPQKENEAATEEKNQGMSMGM